MNEKTKIAEMKRRIRRNNRRINIIETTQRAYCVVTRDEMAAEAMSLYKENRRLEDKIEKERKKA